MKKCLVCDSQVEPFISFGEMPIANGFLREDQFADEFFFDLRVGVCSPGQPGRLGSFLGFTEETVRADIIKALDEIGRPAVLVERMHPSDVTAPREEWISDQLFWSQEERFDLWSLLLGSDAVIGMRSMALLEAALLGCRTASYQPNLIGKNQCAAVHFAVADNLGSAQDVKAWLLESLSAESGRTPLRKRLPFVCLDAADQVASLVLHD